MFHKRKAAMIVHTIYIHPPLLNDHDNTFFEVQCNIDQELIKTICLTILGNVQLAVKISYTA